MATGNKAAISGSMEQDPPDPLTPNLPIIDAVLRVIAWRRRLSHDEAEEFGAWAKLRLIENDFAILRKFRGDSSLQTYLTVVMNRLYLDYVASVTGKFRPSVAARGLGEVGVEFERLVIREKHTVREACRILRSRGRTFSDDELEALALRLPARRSQVIVVDPHDLELVPQQASECPHDAEKRQIRGQLLRRVTCLLRDLPPRDRLIIRMHFLQGASIAEIARKMNEDEQVLRRRLKGLLRHLRRALEQEGFDRSVIRELFP